MLKTQFFLKEMTQINLFTKQKQTHRLREPTYGFAERGRMGGKIVRESGMDICTLLCYK